MRGHRGPVLWGAVLLAAGLAVPSHATPVPSSPRPWSVVDLGREVPFSTTGSCSTSVHVVASFAGKQVSGAAVRGCRGLVTVPTSPALVAAGWQPGTALDLHVALGSTDVPLRYKHLEPDLGKVLAGSPSSVPSAGDPQGDANSLLMSQGDAVDLGLADLTGVYAVFLRSAGVQSFELREGSATGALLASGDAGRNRSDWVLKPRGLGEVYLSATAQLKQHARGPVHLVLVVTQGAGTINYLDLTGSGGMAPYRWPSPLPKAARVFDGRSIRGWKQIGPGTFAVAGDGSLQATGPSSDWGWLYNPRVSLTNFVLRLDVKEQAFGANGGILVRHGSDTNNYLTSFTADEIQVTDVNTEYAGGVDHVATALRQPQSSPGEWSRFEIIANGPRLVVRVNGVVTADHDQTTGCNLPSVPCSGGAYGGYLTGGSGFLGFEAELQKVWYRNILVHDCGVTDAVRQTTTDALCSVAT